MHQLSLLWFVAGVASATGSTQPQDQVQAVDTAVYSDVQTERLVELARVHHRVRTDQLVGYDAKIFTRAEGRLAGGRFARGIQLIEYEAAADVKWRRSGEVRVDILGARSSMVRLPGMRSDQVNGYWVDLFTGDPWFIPNTLGDEIQILGVPDDEALHPLARGAESYYRYSVLDSIQMGLPGRTVRAVQISIEPTVRGPTLLSGVMWLDADSLDVVRIVASVVGERIWDDDPDSPVMRSMEIDLEYGLHQNRFWLPFRQIVAATFDYKYFPGATLPTTTVTTFSEHELEVDESAMVTSLPPGVTGRRLGGRWRCQPFIWDVNARRRDACGEDSFVRRGVAPDGLEWEIRVPSLDSLALFDFGEQLSVARELTSEDLIRARVGDLASLSQEIPSQFATAPRIAGVDWQRVLQAFQYNRVQGPSLGAGYVLYPGPSFTSLHVAGRVSLGDERVLGSLTWRRDGPAARVDIEAFRALRYAEPWTEGVPIGNSLKALFSGHDDADYHLSMGGGLRVVGYQGVLRDLAFTLRFERQRSMALVSESEINNVFFGSGAFQPNPPIAEGDFFRASLVRSFFAGPAVFKLGSDGLFGDGVKTGRFWGSAAIPYEVSNRLGTIRARVGGLVGDSVSQMRFRIGGPETVRGYTYGTRRGNRFWSLQWEQELGVAALWAPVVFADVGDIVTASYDFDPLVGVGIGVSALNGWVRFDFAKGVNPVTGVRFDILIGLPL